MDQRICATEDCQRPARKRNRLCGRCCHLLWPDDPERAKARQRAKTHQRKTVGRHSDITLEYEQQLRRKTRRCPLCHAYLTSKPYLHNSKELDHIVPLNVGGTHTVGNVRIICRLCNLRRPDDGSDYTGPVTLWAAMPGFVPPERVPPSPRCEHGIPTYYRCRICNPPQESYRAADGRRAAVLRAEGWAWKDIALATGFANTGACYGAAQAHGLPEVVARWPARYVNAGTKPAPARQPAQRSLPTAIARAAPPTPPPTPLVCVDCTDPVARGSIRCSECLVEIEESYTELHEPLAVAS
jgi:5-methylcytosine-specific restriction endonuclease McrA